MGKDLNSIFETMKHEHNIIYNYDKYIKVGYEELKRQFNVDFPRIHFRYRNKRVSHRVINLYLRYKTIEMKKKIMLFCSQIIYAPILVEIHSILRNINPDYMVAELSRNSDIQKHVITQIYNGVICANKVLRIVNISNGETVAKFSLHFTMNLKLSKILMLTISFI